MSGEGWVVKRVFAVGVGESRDHEHGGDLTQQTLLGWIGIELKPLIHYGLHSLTSVIHIK